MRYRPAALDWLAKGLSGVPQQGQRHGGLYAKPYRDLDSGGGVNPDEGEIVGRALGDSLTIEAHV